MLGRISRLRLLLPALAVGLGFFTVDSATEPTEMRLDEITRFHTAAMGGESRLAELRSVWRRRNERTFTVRKKPHFHLVLLLNESGGVRYAEGYNGRIAWEQIDDGPRREVGERARTALWHTTQFPSNLNPLHQIRERGHSLEFLGIEVMDDRTFYRLLLTLSDGFEREYYVNAESYRIERSRDTRRHHAYEEKAKEIETIWSDFRNVDGYWFPFTTMERELKTGQGLSGGTMLDIKVNVDIPDETFGLEGDFEAVLAPIK